MGFEDHSGLAEDPSFDAGKSIRQMLVQKLTPEAVEEMLKDEEWLQTGAGKALLMALGINPKSDEASA